MDRIHKAGIHFSSAQAAGSVASEPIPLRVAKGLIAVVKAVHFKVGSISTNATGHNTMAVSSKSDDSSILTERQVETSDRVIASHLFNFFAGTSAMHVLMAGQYIHLPEPGWPVTNDLTFLFLNSNTNTVDLAVAIYYTTKKVSLEEWMRIAKGT